MKKTRMICRIIALTISFLFLLGCGKKVISEKDQVEGDGVSEGEKVSANDDETTEAGADVMDWEEIAPGKRGEDGSSNKDRMEYTLPMTKSLCKDEFLSCGLDEVEPYRKLIESDLFLDGFAEGVSKVQFGLIYLDADDIPELVLIDRDNHVTPLKVYTIGTDGIPVKLFMCTVEWGRYSYRERSGVVSFSDGGQGYSITHYVKVDRDQVSYLGSETQYSDQWAEGEDNIVYRIGAKISDKYIKQIEEERNAFFDANVDLADEGREVGVNEYLDYIAGYEGNTDCMAIEYDPDSRSDREQHQTKCLKKEDFLAFHEPGIDPYRELIERDDSLDGFLATDVEMHYGLFYLDDDNIPELAIVDGDYHIAAYKIYSVGADQKPYEMIMCDGEFGALYYNCKTGVIMLVYGNQGCFTHFFLQVDGEQIKYLGAAFINGGMKTTVPGEIDYEIGLQLSDEQIRGIENDRRFFAGNNGLKRTDVEEGKLVSEEDFDAYCRERIGWEYEVLSYGR